MVNVANFVRRLIKVTAVLSVLIGAGAAGALIPGADRAGAAPAGSGIPVIVVGGLLEWQWNIQPTVNYLSNAGYQVYSWPLPTAGTQDIAITAQQFSGEVNYVLANSGASQVDIVAHSEGGLVARYYMEKLGGAGNVDQLVMLGTPNQGTAVADLAQFFADCATIVACQEMQTGSGFLNNLNSDGYNPWNYTVISTTEDELVVPYWNAFISGADNETVQSWEPLQYVGHGCLLSDPQVTELVVEALNYESYYMDWTPGYCPI